LEKFDFPLSLLQTKEAIEEATYLLCRELILEDCIYAEIRFAPQLHTSKGISQEEAVVAAIKGFKRSEMLGGLILCCMRQDGNENENFATVEVAKRFLGNGVLALDLAGNEAGFSTANFSKLFETARNLGIPFTIHAGEADGAQSVKKAIELGASRIGHGVRSIEDEEVIALLADRKIPLELCPTSNINTAIFSSIEEYPIRYLMERGVVVTVNSDNRSVSATSSKREVDILKHTFDLDEDVEIQLLLNSVSAAFCDQSTKNKLRSKINKNMAHSI
jgi:adenosine deaminase